MKRYAPILIFLFFYLSFFTPPVQGQGTDFLDYAVRRTRLQPLMSHASLGICVYDITDDTVVYALDADHALLPAALNKLITTAAGFSRLGNDFRFKTQMVYNGSIDQRGVLHGNIYIIGQGDPFLGSARFKSTSPDTLFRKINENLRDMGIRRIEGRILTDATLFDDEMVHPTWQWNDIGNYYGSGVTSLNFNENNISVYFSAGKAVGDTATITRLFPANLKVQFINHVVTGPADTLGDINFYGSPTEEIRIARGIIPLGVKDTLIRASMPNPAFVLGDQLTRYLRSHGIPVSGDAGISTSMPPRVHVINTIESARYFDIARLANYTSNNMCAEAIYKYLGYYQEGLGNYPNGQRFMDFYFRELGLDPVGVKMVDGSGLSRDNHVTSRFLCRFLAAVGRQPYYEDFRGTLGVSSQTGESMALPRLPKGCSIAMKGGSMTGVRGYAGYFTNAKGRLYSFAIISNNYDCTGDEMNLVLKGIIEEIVKL